ncbi:hypothetical protein CANCADRAFT_73615 [Tortispora caseinolytica NRRL Y-17796]|uniref:DNA repair metallo-beta-lactamase domain-containing protein n=1 Tax=Tortispora caseinolytica NRRL Y-17796 TaxID=767744 RepID=A0A1E4TIQ9_9ASCO|nr:hypothetical protein CANCADRAFT_73615 [Tortispora caseinolytica NRRL Y-17796]
MPAESQRGPLNDILNTNGKTPACPDDSLRSAKRPKPSSPILCPLCDLDISLLPLDQRESHADTCLDVGPADLPVKPEQDPVTPEPECIKVEEESTELLFTSPERGGFVYRQSLMHVKHCLSDFDSSAAITSVKDDLEMARELNPLKRPPKISERKVPFYKIIPLADTYVAVDAFSFGRIPNVDIFFLSHYHADHYGGLSGQWSHGIIYCSEITAKLVRQNLHVPEHYIRTLPLNLTVSILDFKVTLIDANHCPGAVIFFFESADGKCSIHTGDFRACPSQISHALARKYSKFASLYLDTTYLDPSHNFPNQQQVIDTCAEFCALINEGECALELTNKIAAKEKHSNYQPSFFASLKRMKALKNSPEFAPGSLLILVGTYSIGKERLALAIVEALKTKLYAAPRKRRILDCLDSQRIRNLLTDDPLEAQVHLVSLGSTRNDSLDTYMEPYKHRFSRILSIHPTGWTYRSKPTRKMSGSEVLDAVIDNPAPGFELSDIRLSKGSTRTRLALGVPYSEHSSFRDLSCFCTSIDVEKIIPTVNNGSQESRTRMETWINLWHSRRRSKGLRPHPLHDSNTW